MNKQKGFSLIELMVAMGLVSLVFTISGIQAYRLTQWQKQLGARAENITEMTFAESFIWDKLRNAGVGFNVMMVADDAGNNFYDYISDLPDAMLPAAQKSRSLTLSLDPGKKTELFMLVYDFSLGSTVVYNPSSAYSISESSDITASNFTYTGLNISGDLKTRMGGAWAMGKPILLLNPFPLRRPSTTGIVDMTKPGRPMLFLGQVTANENDLSLLNYSFIRKDDPRDPSNTISTPDRFFRYLPLAAGSAPIVQAIPVQLIRFWLEPNIKNPKTSMLYYGVMENGTTLGRFLLSDDAKALVLERKTISSRLIAAQICSLEKADLCKR